MVSLSAIQTRSSNNMQGTVQHSDRLSGERSVIRHSFHYVSRTEQKVWQKRIPIKEGNRILFIHKPILTNQFPDPLATKNTGNEKSKPDLISMNRYLCLSHHKHLSRVPFASPFANQPRENSGVSYISGTARIHGSDVIWSMGWLSEPRGISKSLFTSLWKY